MSIEIGTKLGPYEILSLIGAGGTGEAYKAKDTRLDRSVAIKVLPSHLADHAAVQPPEGMELSMGGQPAVSPDG